MKSFLRLLVLFLYAASLIVIVDSQEAISGCSGYSCSCPSSPSCCGSCSKTETWKGSCTCSGVSAGSCGIYSKLRKTCSCSTQNYGWVSDCSRCGEF